MTLDGDYFHEREDQWRAATDAMAQHLPQLLAEARAWNSPAVLMRCPPHGHEMIEITLEWNSANGVYFLSPIDESLRSRPKVSRESHPTNRSIGGRCEEPGCPRFVRVGEVVCDDHLRAGVDRDDLGDVRSTLSCPTCTWSAPMVATTLLRTYVEAVRRGISQIRVK